jgi:hypothetical protein
MNLTNGNYIDRFAKDSSGAHGYVFWSADCFQPMTTFVRAESWEDAYDWYLADPVVEARLSIDESDKDTLEELKRSEETGDMVSGVTLNNSGVYVWSESVTGQGIRSFFRVAS